MKVIPNFGRIEIITYTLDSFFTMVTPRKDFISSGRWGLMILRICILLEPMIG